MQLKTIGDQLEAYIPSRYASSWDNVGWMVGPLSAPLRGVLLCVDVTAPVLERALQNDLNLILSHHPLLFEPLSRLLGSHPLHRIVMDAVREDVGVYSVHTNADAMPGGLNDLFADSLDLLDTEPIRPMEDDPEAGLGRVGRLGESLSLGQLEDRLREQFDLTHMQSLGEEDRSVRTVAVCTGSGGDFVGKSLAERADCYVTGDVDHHEAMEAQSFDLPLIILDHYEMETLFLPFAESIWREQFGDQYPLETYRRDNPYRHRLG